MENKKGTKLGEHNPELLSSLMLKAKGPHRTGVVFCEECGISAPTFSRFVNMHNKRPCPIDMLEKIAAHADPNSNVTLEQLLEANGKVQTEEPIIAPAIAPNVFMGAISIALISNGYDCQYSESLAPVPVLGLTYTPSCAVYTNAIDGYSKKRWDFFFWKQQADISSETKRFIRQLLMILGGLHISTITFDKLSFVFSSSQLYKAVIAQTKDLILDTPVSFLLIDTANQRITAQHNIQCNTITPEILFTDLRSIQQKNTLASVDEDNLM